MSWIFLIGLCRLDSSFRYLKKYLSDVSTTLRHRPLYIYFIMLCVRLVYSILCYCISIRTKKDIVILITMNSRLGPPPTRNPATMMTTMGRHALIPTATSLLLLTVLGGGVAAWSANTPPSRSSRSQPLSAASISRSGRGMSTSRRNAARESPLEESPSGPRSSSRRAFLSREMTSAVGAATLFSSCLLGDARSSVAVAAEEVGEEDLIDVYFGCGEFLSFVELLIVVAAAVILLLLLLLPSAFSAFLVPFRVWNLAAHVDDCFHTVKNYQ